MKNHCFGLDPNSYEVLMQFLLTEKSRRDNKHRTA